MTPVLIALAFALALTIGSHYTGACMGMPYALKAKTAGMNFLGSQVTVTGSQWPAELMYTKVDYLAKNPKTVSAMMRGLAVAANVIQTQPAVAIKVLQDTMKLEPEIASGSYGIVKDTFLPRGEFPKDMSKIWKVLIAAKTGLSWIISRETFSGRSAESTTRRTKRSQPGTRSQSWVIRTRRT